MVGFVEGATPYVLCKCAQTVPGNRVRAFSEGTVCAKCAQATEKKEIAGEQVLLIGRVQAFKERRGARKRMPQDTIQSHPNQELL